jgi:hypothetical protein
MPIVNTDQVYLHKNLECLKNKIANLKQKNAVKYQV